MSAQAYITSGILERYVAGITSPDETREVEEMAAQHAEVQEELRAIREALENYILAHEIPLPENLTEKVMHSLADPPKSNTRTKAASVQAEFPSDAPKEAKGVRMASVLPAVLVLALVAACVAAWMFFQETEKAKTALAAAQVEFEKLNQENEKRILQLEKVQEEYLAMRHPATLATRLKGSALDPATALVVYWNNVKQAVLLDVIQLREAPAGKAFQLWAYTAGGAKHLAAVTPGDNQGALIPVTFVENPQSFYLTLEDAGQTSEPTLQQVYAFGRVEQN